MARELAETVCRMPKLDWTQRESVRADLRRDVRRLLAKYGYPPDLSEDATQLVLKQQNEPPRTRLRKKGTGSGGVAPLLLVCLRKERTPCLSRR